MNKRSLVLITVDCLRADRLGLRKAQYPVTPFLDSLASESVVFPDAIVAGVPTYFSFPAIMASRHPLALGRDILGIAPGEPTLATALQEAGYRTAAFLAGNPYLSAHYGYDSGFDTFEDLLASGPSRAARPVPASTNRISNLNLKIQSASRSTRLTAAAYDELYFWYCQLRSANQDVSADQLRPYPTAETIVNRACSWLDSLPSNSPTSKGAFLWLHLMDAHHPHYPPPEARSALGLSGMSDRRAWLVNSFWHRREIGSRRLKRYREEILSLYDASVYWADKQISRLACSLQEMKLWNDTMLVVTADHGEEFLEHGVRYHSPLNLPEELIHVPLIVRAPGLNSARLSGGPFSLIHLAPTLLEGIGVAIPGSFCGHSRWQAISEGILPAEAAISETVEVSDNPTDEENRLRSRVLAIRDCDRKLVVHFSEKKEAFFDLKNDPHEHCSLPADTLVGERAQLLHIALQHLRESRQKRKYDLALRARTRQIRQSLTRAGRDLQSGITDVSLRRRLL